MLFSKFDLIWFEGNWRIVIKFARECSGCRFVFFKKHQTWASPIAGFRDATDAVAVSGTKRDQGGQPDYVRAARRRDSVGLSFGRAARRGKLQRNAEKQQRVGHGQYPRHYSGQARRTRRTARRVQDHAGVVHAQVESTKSLFFLVVHLYSGGAVVQRVRHLGLRLVGRGFKSCSRQRCVTTLRKLFTPMCLCHQAV